MLTSMGRIVNGLLTFRHLQARKPHPVPTHTRRHRHTTFVRLFILEHVVRWS